MQPIKDHIKESLEILFVGYNPSIRSGETGHHYANPSNRFWTILYRSGLTTKKYKPEEDYSLLELGYGFTNIVARPTKAATEITKEEYAEGSKILCEKISYYRPKIVCFVGKGVYEQFSGKKDISWGVQENCVVNEVIDFVAPSSSGLVRMKLDEVIEIYSGLNILLNKKKPGNTRQK